jgi:hypothetical protein
VISLAIFSEKSNMSKLAEGSMTDWLPIIFKPEMVTEDVYGV